MSTNMRSIYVSYHRIQQHTLAQRLVELRTQVQLEVYERGGDDEVALFKVHVGANCLVFTVYLQQTMVCIPKH